MEWPVRFAIMLVTPEKEACEAMYLDTSLPFIPTPDINYAFLRNVLAVPAKARHIIWDVEGKTFIVDLPDRETTRSKLSEWVDRYRKAGFLTVDK
jgi:hypothetical protein